GTDLTRETHDFRWLAFAVLGRREPIEQAAPDHEPNAQRSVEPPWQKQHRPDAHKAKRAGFTGRQRDPVHREPALARERLYAVVIPPTAGPPDCDDCIRAFGGHGHAKATAAVVKPSRAASALDVSCHQTSGRADDATTAHRDNADARFAHRHARNASGRKGSKVGE